MYVPSLIITIILIIVSTIHIVQSPIVLASPSGIVELRDSETDTDGYSSVTAYVIAWFTVDGILIGRKHWATFRPHEYAIVQSKGYEGWVGKDGGLWHVGTTAWLVVTYQVPEPPPYIDGDTVVLIAIAVVRYADP